MNRLAALALVLATAGLPAQSVVQGTLSFADGQRAPGRRAESARVELQPLGPGEPRVARPLANGRFAFADVGAGIYQLSAGHPQGLGALTYLEVPERGMVTVDLRLASRATATLLTVVWAALALLLAGAFAAGILLYGLGRKRGAGLRPTRAERLQPFGSLTLAVLLWCAAFLLFRLIAPAMQPSREPVLNPLSSICAALLAGCTVLVLVEARPRALAACSAVLAGWALVLAARQAALPPLATQLGIGLGLLLWSTAAGCLFAAALRRHGYLVLACWTVALVDVWSVFFGPTGHTVSSAEPAAQARVALMMLPCPVLGADLSQPLIGVGDLLVLAFLLAATARFELGRMRCFWALMAAFTTGIIMTQVTVQLEPDLPGLPALPFLCAFFLLANRGRLTVAPADMRQIRLFVAALAVLIGLHAALRRQPPEPAETVTITRAAPQRSPEWPWDLAALRRGGERVKVSPARPWGERVLLQTLEFDVGSASGAPLVVKGLLARPAHDRCVPVAVVLNREGEALDEKAIGAERDLAVLAVDWSGAGAHLRPDGPVPEQTQLYFAGVAAFQALDYLAARPEQFGRIGLEGHSLGAVVALAVAARDRRVAALALADVGAIEGDHGSVGRAVAELPPQAREAWLQAFAPERAARRIMVPTLVTARTDSPGFSLLATDRLRASLPPATTRFEFLPPLSLKLAGTGSVRRRWLRECLSGRAPLEPSPTLRHRVVTQAGRPVLELSSPSAKPPVRFLVGTGPAESQARHWHPFDAAGSPPSVRLAVAAGTDGLEVLAVDATGFASPLLTLNSSDLPPRRALALGPDLLVGGWEALPSVGVVTAGRTFVTSELGKVRAAIAATAVERFQVALPAGPELAVALTAVERYHLPDERRVGLKPSASGPSRWAFELYPPAEAHQPPPDWPAVDALELSIQGGTVDARQVKVTLGGGLAQSVERVP